MSRLADAIVAGEFVVTAELGPPKGTDVAHLLEMAELMRDHVDAINVTDQQSSVMMLGSLTVCHLLHQRGIEPVFQVTCRDRNRIALQSDLLSAAVLGVENVLCLTGDYVTLGDHPDAKPVFDLDSVTLLQAVAALQEGHDLAGKPLQGTPTFFPGAVVSPVARPLGPQIAKMEKKVLAGARFFQTQAVYDPAAFESFIRQVEYLQVPILVGIILLKSAGMARFMNRNVAGVTVPDALIEEIGRVPPPERPAKSVEIGARLIREMKDMCQGVHIMTLGWEKYVPQLLDQADVERNRRTD
ncbi:MAG TPA: 5,10-methylenetetrahydrofolate reductase [Chloroflexi bacterium]|nr:5,10-methylenetetrahydrofolate reductase [Chloroflexota bacterium]